MKNIAIIFFALIACQSHAQTEEQKISNWVDTQFSDKKVQSAYINTINIQIYQKCKFASNIALIEVGSIPDKEKRMSSKVIWSMMNKGLEQVERKLIASGYSRKNLDDMSDPYMNRMIALNKAGNKKEISKIMSECRDVGESIFFDKLGYN